MEIWCCTCEADVKARLTNGAEVYPHRKDLYGLPFWRCDDCGNWVGCHRKTTERTRPLGCIPGPDMRRARGHIHNLIDPLWESGRVKRGALYARMSEKLGFKYHTADLRTIDDARAAYRAGLEIARDLSLKEG